jgi:hypothetical protein
MALNRRATMCLRLARWRMGMTALPKDMTASPAISWRKNVRSGNGHDRGKGHGVEIWTRRSAARLLQDARRPVAQVLRHQQARAADGRPPAISPLLSRRRDRRDPPTQPARVFQLRRKIGLIYPPLAQVHFGRAVGARSGEDGEPPRRKVA